jgi:hypothetical protein
MQKMQFGSGDFNLYRGNNNLYPVSTVKIGSLSLAASAVNFISAD